MEHLNDIPYEVQMKAISELRTYLINTEVAKPIFTKFLNYKEAELNALLKWQVYEKQMEYDRTEEMYKNINKELKGTDE